MRSEGFSLWWPDAVDGSDHVEPVIGWAAKQVMGTNTFYPITLMHQDTSTGEYAISYSADRREYAGLWALVDGTYSHYNTLDEAIDARDS